jgi:hypothetical protein
MTCFVNVADDLSSVVVKQTLDYRAKGTTD